jgi:predicted Zn-dependent peptidase
MRALIEERFNSWPAKTPPALRVDSPAPIQGKRLLLVDKPDSTQTYFYIGNTGIARTNPDRVGIAVVNTIFGGRFTSRLNNALRVDSGLTYGARSTFDQRKVAGPFLINTYTRNESTEQAMDLARKVLATLHQTGITETELSRQGVHDKASSLRPLKRLTNSRRRLRGWSSMGWTHPTSILTSRKSMQ